MSVLVEVKGKDERGRFKTKQRFFLCEECSWEMLKDVDFEEVSQK